VSLVRNVLYEKGSREDGANFIDIVVISKLLFVLKGLITLLVLNVSYIFLK
jgi:hypothetical protein